jgi:hypothetical protein
MASLETEAIIHAAKAFDPSVAVTSVTTGTHALTSYHYRDGTDGRGLAVDFDFYGSEAERKTKRLALATNLLSLAPRLAELFYTPLGESVKYGAIQGFTVTGHNDHVHVAVEKGTFLAATSAKPTGEDDMDKTDAVEAPDGGVWVLGKDGGVFAYGGAPFHGSYPGLPPAARQGDRYFLKIKANGPRSADGYTLIASDGSKYKFPV